MTKKLQAFLSSDSRLWLMGFAILMVISLHFSMYGNLMRYDLFRLLFSKGYLGVDIFLFLSSYGLCFSYTKNTLFKYYSNRFKRLFPMYFVFLTILLLVTKTSFQFPKIIIGLFQLTGISLFTGIEIEWFIPALILLYMLFPLLYIGINLLYKSCFTAIPLLLFLITIASPHISQYVSGFLVARIPIIISGILFYLSAQDNDDKRICLTSSFLVVLSILFTTLGLIDEKIVCTLCIPALILLISQIDIVLPFQKPMQFLGKHTLEIYLAQNLALNQFYANNDMNFILKTGVAFGIIVAGSVVLWAVQDGWHRIVKRV